MRDCGPTPQLNYICVLYSGFPEADGRVRLPHRSRDDLDLCELEGAHHVQHEAAEVSCGPS